MIRAALAGNPNVGKSTVFNALTGLKQHTGNWPGKTVGAAEGGFTFRGQTVKLADLPGIYSLASRSAEEEEARRYLLTERPDCVICVCDASSLERNLILAGQLRELSAEAGFRLILCVNLMDEAEARGIRVDPAKLSAKFGCPVIPAAARNGTGLDELKEAVLSCAAESEAVGSVSACAECGLSGDCSGGCPGCGSGGCSGGDRHAVFAAEAAREAVSFDPGDDPAVRRRARREERWDRFFCGRLTGIPVMILLTAAVFWLTLRGSGYLSEGLDFLLNALLRTVTGLLAPHLPEWLVSLICGGILGTVFRVTAVMLPPMAVFFPLFTLLEDLGYLPRAAFCMDRCFAACGSCGKQSLTMCLGKFRVSD